jgi:hypothetical protein
MTFGSNGTIRSLLRPRGGISEAVSREEQSRPGQTALPFTGLQQSAFSGLYLCILLDK